MTENKKENLNNRMIKFLFEGAPVRGACVQMAEEWQEMIKFHHYPENVAATRTVHGRRSASFEHH